MLQYSTTTRQPHFSLTPGYRAYLFANRASVPFFTFPDGSTFPTHSLDRYPKLPFPNFKKHPIARYY